MTPETSVTAAAAEAAPPARGRFAGLLFLGLGALLLAVLAFWVVSSLRAGPGPGEGTESLHTVWLGSANGLMPPSALSVARQEEIRNLYDAANQLVSTHAARSRSAARWGQYADWFAFGLSSLLMMLAGYFGRLPESGFDATAAAQALQAQQPPKKKGRSRGARAVSSRSGFAALVGVIAALAATSTGASNRLQAASAQSLASAKTVSESLVKFSKVATAPTSDADLEEALQSLRQTLEFNAP